MPVLPPKFIDRPIWIPNPKGPGNAGQDVPIFHPIACTSTLSPHLGLGGMRDQEYTIIIIYKS